MKKPLLLALMAFGISAQAQNPGSLDLSFDPGTGANEIVSTTALQPDGKIVIGGFFTSYNGTARNQIARLNADGTLDSSFNTGTGFGGGPYPTVYASAVQPDGKIVIGGYFSSYDGTAINHIARLNEDGSLDSSFTVGLGADDIVRTIALQPDGKTVIGGEFDSYNGTASKRIARLNTDGTLDVSFNVGMGASGNVLTTAIQPDGKIIIAGGFNTYNGTSSKNIARLNADGTLDGSFTVGVGAAGSTFFPEVRTTAIQPDGKIIIGGNFNAYNGTAMNNIARLNTDGIIDASFSVGTGVIGGSVWTIAIQPDGQIIIGGNFTSYNGTASRCIARLNADGTLDGSFNVGTGAISTVYTTAIQPDGKIIIGGSFTVYDGTARARIARLHGGDMACQAGFDLYPDPDVQHNWFALNTSVGAPPFTCTWDWGDGSSSTGTNVSHIYSTPGYYNICVSLIDAMGCISTYCDSSTYVYKTEDEMITINVIDPLVTGQGQSSMDNGPLSIFPNPTSTILNITGMEGNTTLKLYDVLGKMLLTTSTSLNSTEMNVSQFPQGIYVLVAENGKGLVAERVVIN